MRRQYRRQEHPVLKSISIYGWASKMKDDAAWLTPDAIVVKIFWHDGQPQRNKLKMPSIIDVFMHDKSWLRNKMHFSASIIHKRQVIEYVKHVTLPNRHNRRIVAGFICEVST